MIDGHDQVEIPKGQTAFIPAKIETLDLNLAQDSRIALIYHQVQNKIK